MVPWEGRRTPILVPAVEVGVCRFPTSHSLDEEVLHPSQPLVPVREPPLVRDRMDGEHEVQTAVAAAGVVPPGEEGA